MNKSYFDILSNFPNVIKFLNSFDDIWLEEDSHTYFLKSDANQKFTSATTVIKKHFAPFDGEAIAMNLIEKVPKYKDRTVQSLLDEWASTGIDGTATHLELENYILYGHIPKTKKGLSGLPCIDKIMSKGKYIIIPEAILYSKEYGIAGTADLLLINKYTGEILILDWKTNKAIRKSSYDKKVGLTEITKHLQDCNFIHYTLQMSLYRLFLEKFYDLKVVGQYIVHLTDGEYKLIETDYLHDEIVGIIEYFKHLDGNR